jgi:hypothetical protein
LKNSDKLIEKIQGTRDVLVEEFLEDFENENDDEDDLYAELRQSIYYLIDKFKHIEDMKATSEAKLSSNNIIECPKQTCNNERSNIDYETSLYKYIIFVGMPSLLTLILAFVIFFILFELKLVEIYKR